MSAAEIDAYLDDLDEPKRSTLSQLRRDILAAVPDAEQCISYAVPGFKVAGKNDRRLRCLQESPELPAPQRLGVPRVDRTSWPATRSHPEPCDSPSTSPYRPSWSTS